MICDMCNTTRLEDFANVAPPSDIFQFGNDSGMILCPKCYKFIRQIKIEVKKDGTRLIHVFNTNIIE